ncbi:MAG: hypothetical protein ACPGPG_04780 [Luminiphilus sp.]
MKFLIFTSVAGLALLNPNLALSQHDHADEHDHDAGHEQHSGHDHSEMAEAEVTGDSAPVALSVTPEIEAALADGGSPVVAEVLGVVCDFCATAMNKIFGAREEVAAVYVDLDTKALNLVLKAGSDLDNATIESLAVQAGYRIAAVHRDPKMQGS